MNSIEFNQGLGALAYLQGKRVLPHEQKTDNVHYIFSELHDLEHLEFKGSGWIVTPRLSELRLATAAFTAAYSSILF